MQIASLNVVITFPKDLYYIQYQVQNIWIKRVYIYDVYSYEENCYWFMHRLSKSQIMPLPRPLKSLNTFQIVLRLISIAWHLSMEHRRTSFFTGC